MPDGPSQPDDQFTANHRVEVLPRYLAGPGPDDLAAVWPFPTDQGWTVHAPAQGMQIAASACHRVRCGTRNRRTWLVEVHEDGFGPLRWRATFDGNTPAELLADFHTELLRSYGTTDEPSTAFLDKHTRPDEAYRPLLTAGWRHEVATHGQQQFTSPDHVAELRHRYAPSGRLDTWTIAVNSDWLTSWAAEFTTSTPVHLIRAVTTSLVATEPLVRTMDQVSPYVRRLLGLPARSPEPSPGGPAAQAVPSPTRLPAVPAPISPDRPRR